MAIGWMYRDDYRHGGIRLAATQQPIGWAARSTVYQALFYAVLMIPVALWTTFLGVTGVPYAIIAAILSIGYLWYTIRFAAILRDPSAESTRTLARSLLKAQRPLSSAAARGHDPERTRPGLVLEASLRRRQGLSLWSQAARGTLKITADQNSRLQPTTLGTYRLLHSGEYL